MMRSALSLAAVALLGLFASTAQADHGRISRRGLQQLGLGQLRVVSDHQGMQVRGRSASAMGGGAAVFGIFLFEPNTSSFFQFNAGNSAMASEENAGLQQQAGSNTSVTTAFSGLPLTTINFGGNVTSFLIQPFNLGGTTNAFAQ